MSTVDTSTWNPDADLNTAIEGIPLNSNASIAQTWQALRVLMAAVKGDGDAIKAMIDVMQGATASADGASGLVPAPEAGDHDKVLKGDGTWGTVASVNGHTVEADVPANAVFTDSVTAQNVSTSNNTYPVLIGSTNNATTNIGNKATYFSKFVRLNPSTGVIYASGYEGSVSTSSDARLKTPLSAVPDDVLNAWEAVNWGQFRYLDAVERKGEAARLHLGLIAQKVKGIFEERGLDVCRYGILCRGDDGYWTVRYAEASVMEALCQRRRADRLEARITALEERLDG